MRTLSLFSGIGGMDLGLERAGFQIVAQCEQDPFCRAVLAKHWPGVPCFDDVRTIDPASVGPVDCVCGGFPCQDVSVAGKGAGVDAGARSGLWKEMHRVIDALRPSWVIAENVPALRTRGADRVLRDLEGIGYACWPLVVGVEHVGGPHKRHRVFIVAHTGHGGVDQRSRSPRRDAGERLTERGVSGEHRAGGGMADTIGDGRGTRGGVGGDEGGEGLGWRESAGGGKLEHTLRAGREERNAPGEPGEPRQRSGRRSQVVNTQRDNLGRNARAALGSQAEGDLQGSQNGAGRDRAAQSSAGARWPAGPGQPQHHWEAPRLIELPLGGTVDGVPVRLVRFANRSALKGFGNAVCPQVAELIGETVMRMDAELRGAA